MNDCTDHDMLATNGGASVIDGPSAGGDDGIIWNPPLGHVLYGPDGRPIATTNRLFG